MRYNAVPAVGRLSRSAFDCTFLRGVKMRYKMRCNAVPAVGRLLPHDVKIYQSDLGHYNINKVKSAVQIEVAVAPATPRPATLAM